MKIKKVQLTRFRQFSDTTFHVGPFNVLVGPNNCGKTTVLHAIRAFFYLVQGHVFFEGTPPSASYHRRFLAAADEVAPTPDIVELWHKKQPGKPLSITVTFEDDVAFPVVLRQQFGQIHVSMDELPPGLSEMKLASYFTNRIAFIPGLVGVLVTEPYATAARRNALAAQGRYSEIFRSSLQQLKVKTPELVKTINEWLQDLFDITVSTIDFNDEADEFVTVKYKQSGSEFDIVSSGAGLQQVVQMLAYLYLSQPKVLLIDEPDAHLHSKLQARLGQLFRRVADDLDAQVFLSTHSLDLIDTFSTTEVLVVDALKVNVAPIGNDADLVSALVDANVVDVSALSRLLASRRLVVIEDEDQTILKAIDKVVGTPLFSSKSSSFVLPAKGVGNFRAIAQLGKVLHGLTGTDFDLTFVQDRDGVPDFLVDQFLAAQEAEGIRIKLLQRHEIENYLIEPKLISAATALAGRTIDEEGVSKAIRCAAANLKSKARVCSLKTAKDVNRHLAKNKLDENELEEQVYDWFDKLDFESMDTIQRVFPGKELLAETLRLLNEMQGKQMTRGLIVAAIQDTYMAPEIRELLRELSNSSEERDLVAKQPKLPLAPPQEI